MLGELVTAKKAALEITKAKIEEMESTRSLSIDAELIEAQTINQALKDQKKELDENLILAEEDMVEVRHADLLPRSIRELFCASRIVPEPIE